MIDHDTAKELLARDDLSNGDKLLVCLAVEPIAAKKVAEIKDFAISVGLRTASKWNISSLLSKAKTLTIRTANGWELTNPGRAHIATIAAASLPSVSVLVVSALRNQLSSIANADAREFVAEAVRCLEAKLYRAAIIMSWVGAVAVLYDAVITLHLAPFIDPALINLN